MFKRLREYLAKHFPADYKPAMTDEQVKGLAADKIKAGQLSTDLYIDLISPEKGAADPLEKLSKMIGGQIATAMEPIGKRLDAMEKRDQTAAGAAAATATADAALETAVEKAMKKLNVAGGAGAAGGTGAGAGTGQRAGNWTETEEDPLKTVAGGTGGGARVKRVSERYDGNRVKMFYPDQHKMAGQPVVYNGRAMERSSQRERALCGAYVKHTLAVQTRQAHLLSEHDRDLLDECVKTMRFSGQMQDGRGETEYDSELLSDGHQKSILNDATSGGQYLVPDVLENDIVVFPLLHGEIYPWVTTKTLAKGDSVDTIFLGAMTITSAANEATPVPVASTNGLLTRVQTPIFNAHGAIKLGRDFLSDTSIDIMDEITDGYQQALLKWLDDQIPNGDGTTEPLGIFNTTGTNIVSATNTTVGPFIVKDFEHMIAAVGKQYRPRGDSSVRWLSNDSTYFRARGIPVSATDQRRIFGLTHEDYEFMARGWGVQNDIPNTNLAFGGLRHYRMYRRLGIEIRISDDGQTLMLENAVLVVVRSRWGGRLMIGAAFAECNNSPAVG